MGLTAVILCAAFSFSPNAQAARDSTRDSTTVGAVASAADSTKPILLAPVVIPGHRPSRPGDATWIPSSARFLYPDDGSKLLLGDLRVTSALPASADLRLYGLPVDQTARDYVWEHRIGGPTTAVFGSRTKVNPDVVALALHPFLMSHQYRDTNGSLEWRPEYQSSHVQALRLSSDLIERRATLWISRGSSLPAPFELVTSVRQSDVVPFLTAAVPALRVIPRYTDSQTYASWRVGKQTIQSFLLFGRETGDWRETVDSVEAAVIEHTRQDLAIVRVERPLSPDSKLTAGIGWEGDHVSSDHRYGGFDERTQTTSHILNPRVEVAMAGGAVTAWASQFCVESEPGGSWWRNSLDAGMESRATRGWLTVRPSLAFQRFHDEGTIVHGVTVSTHSDPVTLTAGYGTYADYFRFHDGIFGNVFDPGEAQRPQIAIHYVASAQYEPRHRRPFDLLRITAVRKDLDVDLSGDRQGVRVLAWDGIVASGGTPSWELAFLTNDARSHDGPLVGMIPISVRLGLSGDLLRATNVSVEANYRSGSVAEYRTPGPHYGERFMLEASHYVNVAVTQRFTVLHRPANATVTVFNALAVAGSRAELTVDEYGRRYDAPCWANVRLRYDLW